MPVGDLQGFSPSPHVGSTPPPHSDQSLQGIRQADGNLTDSDVESSSSYSSTSSSSSRSDGQVIIHRQELAPIARPSVLSNKFAVRSRNSRAVLGSHARRGELMGSINYRAPSQSGI